MNATPMVACAPFGACLWKDRGKYATEFSLLADLIAYKHDA